MARELVKPDGLIARQRRVYRVLVNSPDVAVAEALRGLLPPLEYELVISQPGLGFLKAARCRPEIAIIDRVNERPDAAEMEVAILKEACADVRIIALSGQPSARDGQLVEQGVFYYMTMGVGPELVRLIQAAARSLPHSMEQYA